VTFKFTSLIANFLKCNVTGCSAAADLFALAMFLMYVYLYAVQKLIVFFVNCSYSNKFEMLNFREFLIFAPKIVRPDMVYEVYVTVNRKYYSNIVVTALLSSDGNEYISGQVPFQDVGTKIIQLKVCSGIANTYH